VQTAAKHQYQKKDKSVRKKLNVSLFTLLVAATPSLAQFEGTVEMKVSMADKDGNATGSGTINLAVGKAGVRSELNVQHGAMGVKMVTLQKSSVPDKTYHIYDTTRTYSEMDLAKLQAMAGAQQSNTTYTVKKLGTDKILGFDAQHVLLQQQSAGGEKGPTTEMWTARNFLDYATFSKLQAGHGRMAGQEGLLKALKAAGADGMPLKSVTTAEDGSKTTMQVVRAEKETLPASTFEIPEGYTKSASDLGDMLGGVSGPQADEAKKRLEEAKKKLEEMLKNMTPEQRQMYEDMMKRRGNNP
jgi:hypothetical protein